MQFRYNILICLLICYVMLHSCTANNTFVDGDVDNDDQDDQNAGEELIIANVSELTVVENSRNVLSVYVHWKTDIQAYSLLEIKCGDYYHEYFKDFTRKKNEHQFFVMGLLADTNCVFTAHSTTYTEFDNSLSKNYMVSGLPEYMAQLDINIGNQRKIQPGWVLTNLSDHCGIYPSSNCNISQNDEYSKKPLLLVLLDEEGRYRWYYRHYTSFPGEDVDVRTFEEGVLAGGGGIDPAYITWEGKVMWSRSGYVHHHIEPYLANEQYVMLTYEGGCPEEFNGFKSDVINIWDRNKNDFVFRWKICDHYIPDVIQYDWSHMNTVEFFPLENSWLFSCRNQHAIFKLDLETEEIVWKMGLNGDFIMKDNAQFYRQHDPQILDNGNILLFDNGHSSYRQYSRAIEIEYDDINMQAKMVWSYTPNPTIYAPVYGDADRMPNGNTLIVFGQKESNSESSRIMEVSTDGEEIWEILTPYMWSIYRAEKIYQPPKGYRVLDL